MNAVEKRRATILKKRENRETRKQLYQNKKAKIGDIKYSEYQLKYVNEIKRPLIKKVLACITNVDFKHATQLKIKYKSVNNAVIQIRVEKQNLTKRDILTDIEQIKQLYIKKKINVKFEIVLLYENGWKSGKITNLIDQLNVYDPIEYNTTQLNNNIVQPEQQTFNKYDIFIIEEPINILVGASYDSMNNCLYECLKEMLPKEVEFFDSPLIFKRFLNVRTADKIDILKAVSLIENKLNNKYKINIYGDVNYLSSVNSHKVINLKVHNNHVEIKHNELSLNVQRKKAYDEKTILLYNQKTFFGYNGEKTFFINKQFLIDIYKHKTKYIIIFKGVNKITFEDEYKTLINIANELKIHSKNKINLYKTGNYTNTALELFNNFNKTIYTEKIDQNEGQIIQKASIGSIIFYKPYSGPAYEYDIISMYPSILLTNLLIPVQKGESNFIKNEDFQKKEYYAYGLYHCIIKMSDSKEINNLFRYNSNNWYTSIDLKRANELNLSINIIENGQVNFIYYNSSKCVRACDLFKDYIDIVYKLKKKKIDGSKIILNCLWGSLSEKKKVKYSINIDDNFIIPDNHEITSFKSIDNKILLNLSNNDNIYKTNYARLSPFLLSQARYNISKIIEPYKNDVINCHTDGFYLPYNPKLLKIGFDIGQLKYKGYCENYSIKNCNSKIGEFK